MEFEEFIKKQKIEIRDVKYPISKTKIKEDYVVIYLEEEKINVSIEDYFAYGLKSLEGLDDKLYEELKDKDRLLMAYQKCLRRLSQKDYSVYKIRRYLLDNCELNEDETKKIIDRLESYGLLDDEKFCKAKLAYYENSLMSNKDMKMKLKKEGIAEDIIKENLVYDYDKELNKAKQLASKYNGVIKNCSLNSKRQKLIGKLVNAGFSYDTASDAIKDIDLSVENELESLKRDYRKAKDRYCRKYSDYDLRSRIYSNLLNRGYRSEDIKKVMEDI